MSNKCDFYGLTGTPDVQVDKPSKVPLEFNLIKIDCSSILLMAGKGSRMKSIDKIKKPYLIYWTLLNQIINQPFQFQK